MNHCPVYCSIGGHAYGSVYPGPIGAVLTPALAETPEAGHLAQASTFCGRCEEVCPVEIPLVSLMRHWREVAIDEPGSWRSRKLLRAWAFLAARPRAYRLVARIAAAAPRSDGARQREATYAALRRAMDAPPRLPGAAGAHLSGSLRATATRGGAMSRERILGAIRTTLDADDAREPRDGERRRSPGAPGRASAPGPDAPAGGRAVAAVQGLPAHLGVDLIEVGAAAEIPAAIAGYLHGLGLPLRLRRGTDPLLCRTALGKTRRRS